MYISPEVRPFPRRYWPTQNELHDFYVVCVPFCYFLFKTSFCCLLVLLFVFKRESCVGGEIGRILGELREGKEKDQNIVRGNFLV